MKKILAVFSLVFLATGFAFAKNQKMSKEVEKKASNNLRWPASQDRYLSSEYGDDAIYFCDDGTAMVMSDPNRCREARAKGQMGCTELAPYFEKVKFSLEKGAVGPYGLKIKPDQKSGGYVLLFDRQKTLLSWKDLAESEKRIVQSNYCQ